jgi:hypothetical protein
MQSSYRRAASASGVTPPSPEAPDRAQNPQVSNDAPHTNLDSSVGYSSSKVSLRW